jgi:SSS family solute:Na+ symporter
MGDGFLGFIFTNSLYSGVIAMLGGLIIVPIVSLLTPKPDAKEIEHMFECYQKEVTVKTKESLGE